MKRMNNKYRVQSNLKKMARRKNTEKKNFATASILIVAIIIIFGIIFILKNNQEQNPNSFTNQSTELSSSLSSITSGGSGNNSGNNSGKIETSELLSDINSNSASDISSEVSSKSSFSNSASLSNSAQLLSNKLEGWSYTPAGKTGFPATTSPHRISLCDSYDGIWQDASMRKKVYITMDVGYEYNNNTSKILDIAKQKNFKINFFITGALFKTDDLKKLVLRMSSEGHLIGNHTWNHPSMPSLYKTEGEAAIKNELAKIENAYRELTGKSIAHYMRPPRGEFSEITMKLTNDMGYKTVFWSFAYRDWLLDAQPTISTARKAVIDNLHDGTVYLLHTVSNTNVAILPYLVDEIRKAGYEISLISDIK